MKKKILKAADLLIGQDVSITYDSVKKNLEEQFGKDSIKECEKKIKKLFKKKIKKLVSPPRRFFFSLFLDTLHLIHVLIPTKYIYISEPKKERKCKTKTQ